MSDYTPTGNPISASRGVSGLIRAEFALIQTAVNSKGNYAGQVWTGTHNFTGATLTVQAPALGDISTSVATTAFAMTMQSPAFSGTPSAPTAALGNSSTQLATTAFVAGTAFSSALPAQTGNSGKYVTTDGVNASWGTINFYGQNLYAHANLGGF